MSNVFVRESRIGQQGVFATRAIEEGEVIREFVIEREVTKESPLRPGEPAEHCALIDGRFQLVAEPDRYFNHSCDPNVYNRFADDRIEVVARRAIQAGSELTLDYLINNSGGDSWECSCGAARCRGKTGFSFFTLPLEIQREYLPLLAPWFRRRHAGELDELVARLEES